MTNLTDIQKQKYCYCNYCKHFVVEDSIFRYFGIPLIGYGYCNNKSIFLSNRRKYYYNNCDKFSYSIHNRFGFNDPDEIFEFAVASHPPFMFRNVDLKIEK